MKKKKLIICLSTIFLVSIIFGLYFVIAGSFNPDDERLIGYEFLDNNSVVHIWNNATISDYFFDKESGIQLTNHYEEYWSRNIFCVGYYSGEEWIKIKCADELEGFTKSIETDNLTYVDATLWKDIEWGIYDFRLAVNYYLGLNDKNLSITIYGKNLGVDIPYDLGFAWKVVNVNIPPDGIDDKILINNTDYLLNGTYDLIFKNINESNFKIYSSCQYLKLDWDKNLNYAVKMYGYGNQESFYVALLINAGHFNSTQEKSTTFYWIDLPQCIGEPMPCLSHTTYSACLRCGCDWETGRYVNVGDVWRDVEEVYVNVGDVWRDVETVKINVGDSWRIAGGCGGTPLLCSYHDDMIDCDYCGCLWTG